MRSASFIARTVRYAGVPSGSTTVGLDSYIAPNGDLYVRDTIVATGVTSATTDYLDGTGDTLLTFTGGSC